MKMAKANENDLNTSLEMCRALEALEGGYLPAEMTDDDDGVAYYADEHAEKVVEHLLAIHKRASLFRVCFGMTVLLDPQNELVDPNTDTLEAHPKFSRIAAHRNELLAALSLAKSAFIDADHLSTCSSKLLSALNKVDGALERVEAAEMCNIGTPDRASIELQQAEELRSEYWRAVQSASYEYGKRVERFHAALVKAEAQS